MAYLRLLSQHFIRVLLAGFIFSTLSYADEGRSNKNHKNNHHGNKHNSAPHHVEKRQVTVHYGKPRPEIIQRGNVRHVESRRGSVYHADAHHGHVPRHHAHRFYDSHHGHNHYYFQRGHRVTVLPSRHEVIIHRGLRFYFSTGVWYVPDGPRFIVTVPPIGLTVRILPSIYTKVWVGRVPYYYANNIYYVQTPQGYMVTEAPAASDITATAPADNTVVAEASSSLFAYPRQGQSKKQEDQDRYECHNWGVDQADYDPSAGSSVSVEKSADYRRAISACLEGRGYTVR